MNKTLVLAPLLLAAACVDASDAPEPTLDDPRPIFKEPLEGKENNGPFLLGEQADALVPAASVHYYVSGAATGPAGPATVSVVQGHLLATTFGGNAAQLTGLRLHSPLGGDLEIRGSQPVDPTTGFGSYDVWQRSSTGAAWQRYCPVGVAATPFAGRFQRDDVLVPIADSITFACGDGAAGKCASWGLIPGASPQSLEWTTFQACVRAVEADYCGDGESHTLFGTTIEMHDGVPGTLPDILPDTWVHYPTTWPPAVDDPTFYFEAAWTTADVANGSGSYQQLVCLSRRRWQTMPLGGSCPDALPDPRLLESAKFCEDMTVPQMQLAGAVFFNASAFNDIALHRWRKGSDDYTTVDGFHNDAGRPDIVPANGFNVYVAREGIILRTLPASIPVTDVVALRGYKHAATGERALTTAASRPAGYMMDGFIGYVFKAARTDTVPLYLYYNVTSADYRTTVSTTPGAGYALLATLGHIWP